MPKIKYVQEAPNCVQVELVEGCNLRCSFCGLNGIRGKENNFKFASMETLENTASQIKKAGWNPRIEFAMHGEPSQHPQLVEAFRLFREILGPSISMMMTSNGGGLVKNPTDLIDGCLESLNVVALDAYEGIKLVPNIITSYVGKHPIKYYPQDKTANPHVRRKAKERLLVIIQDIKEATNGTHHMLNNHTGCGAPKNLNGAGKRCAKPFREISVRWDGNIAICCNDWRGIFKCGNVNEKSMSEIWLSEEFEAARRKLYHGMRDFGPCEGCDATSYRTGLLPDKYGKVSLDQPSQYDLEVIERATSGKSYALPVLRPWEIK